MLMTDLQKIGLFELNGKRREVKTMGIVKHEDVVGYRFDNKIVCLECITDDEFKGLEEDEFILSDEVESSDDRYFCDRRSSDKCTKTLG